MSTIFMTSGDTVLKVSSTRDMESQISMLSGDRDWSIHSRMGFEQENVVCTATICDPIDNPLHKRLGTIFFVANNAKQADSIYNEFLRGE